LAVDTSDTGLFEAEIRAILAAKGPLKTKDIYPAIKARFPERCDDSELDEGNGEVAWKHRVRAAQERLKNKSIIAQSVDSKCWYLV